MTLPRIPLASYRLQFNRDFTFRHAADALNYLARLGISDVYASPLLQSRLGSQHGYDVTDPSRIDSELGNEQQFETFRRALQKEQMGLLLDIVPNHMAASSRKSLVDGCSRKRPRFRLRRLLRYRLASAFPDARQQNSSTSSRKFLCQNSQQPGISNHISKWNVLDSLLRHVFSRSRLRSIASILKHREHVLEKSLGPASSAFQEYLGIVAALAPSRSGNPLAIDVAGQRRLQVQGIKERLRQLYEAHPQVQRFVKDNLRIFNGRRNDPASLRDLDRLLSEQAYVLSYWQNVNEAINYRRFFTITDLLGVRVEDAVVFDATHQVVLNLIERKVVTGLRIDHIDGLRDPLAYLRRLQQACQPGPPKGKLCGFLRDRRKNTFRNGEASRGMARPRNYRLRISQRANRLFVHPEGAREIEKIYFKFLGRKPVYDEVLYEKKKLVMATLLSAEMRYLGRLLGVLSQRDRYARDLPRMELEQALIEIAACFPVYRTYVRSWNSTESNARHRSRRGCARPQKPRLDPSSLRFRARRSAATR